MCHAARAQELGMIEVKRIGNKDPLEFEVIVHEVPFAFRKQKDTGAKGLRRMTAG
jgi:hypothetical protein